MRRYFPVVFCLYLTACSLGEYNDAELPNPFENIPNVILEDAQYTVVRDNRARTVGSIEQMEIYPERELIEMRGLGFLQFDEKGELKSKGNAGEALYEISTENATLSESVHLFFPEEEISLRSQALQWTKEEQIIRSLEGSYTEIERGEKTRMGGLEFSVDLKKNEITAQKASGSFRDEKRE